MSKLYDVKVVVGEYEKNGERKKRYADVGVILNGEYGPYMIMNRYFNPAGVPGDSNDSGFICKLFKPEQNQEFGQQNQGYDQAAGPAAYAQQQQRQPNGAPVFNPNPPSGNVGTTTVNGGFESDIPF